MNNSLMNIKQAAEYLNVSQDCLRKWDKDGKLKPLKTSGGHRRYSKNMLDEYLGLQIEKEKEKEIICATYARVSSLKQKKWRFG